MIEVLSVTSEVYPLIKTGGLADVAGALPKAMAPAGVRMRTIVPGYAKVLNALGDSHVVTEFGDLFGGPARLLSAQCAGLDLFVIDAPHLYLREGGPYSDPSGTDYNDNWRRFAALSWLASEICYGLVDGYQPAILHAHDWQAGLAPAYVNYRHPRRVKTVMTVHNLAFQGQFPAEIFSMLRLPSEAYSMDGVEYYGGIGFLKAGLLLADAVTTVSPSYALEIRSVDQGMGMDGLLNSRAQSLSGILNGIDVDEWDPGSDPNLAANFRMNSVHLRSANKTALERRFGLEHSDGPLFGLVSRLTWQKGIDLLAQIIDPMVEMGARLVVLGSGDPGLEAALRAAVDRHPRRIGFISDYDEPLSHLIQGGSDAILVPSRFEPCGLTQMYGLRYGAVPVVARVGGLADTIIDANEAALQAGVATGVQFFPVTDVALLEAIRRSVALYHREKTWKRIQRRGMKSEVSWQASAKRYVQLYKNLLGMKDDDDQDD